MKNITFSTQDDLVAQARALARARGTTLNEEFRLWLAGYVAQQGQSEKTAQLRTMLDELTAQVPGSPNVPVAFVYTPVHQREAVRSALNEREQRMLARLGG